MAKKAKTIPEGPRASPSSEVSNLPIPKAQDKIMNSLIKEKNTTTKNSKSAKAGLTLPVIKVLKTLKLGNYAKRIRIG